MPILKFTASADTTITNAFFPNTTLRALYSNMGAADSLEIFSVYLSGSESQKSRILIKFDNTEISSSRVSGLLPASGSVNFYLRLFNVEHPEALAKKYYVSINPISSSWDEGYGLDLDSYTDIGVTGSRGYGSNWIYSKRTNTSLTWSQQGGDILTGYEKTFYFDTGLEDLSVDITDLVEAQLSNTIENHGFVVNLSGAYEDGTNQETYYTKRFSARSSEYFYKVPRLEARWKSVINDNRGNFYYASNNLSDSDNEQNIYFYNRINGNLKDLPNSAIPFVKIFDEDNMLLTSSILTTKVSTGTYKAVFKLTGNIEQTLKDVWYSGSSEYYTGSIEAYVRNFDDSISGNEYVISLTNLKNEYSQVEKPIIKIFVREKDWSPNVYKIAYKEIKNLILDNLYYKIVRTVDSATIIDYGIEPVAYTQCSYDKNGNYMLLDMSLFEKGYSYGIKFMTLQDGVKKEFKEVFKFKVE